MAVFGFKTQTNELVDKFVSESNKRLNSYNIVKNPFNGKIKRIGVIENESYYAVSMTPLYFPFYWFGLLMVIAAYIFTGFTIGWWMLPGTLIFGLGIFSTASFFYLMLTIGLRKIGYKDKIKRVCKSKVIEIMID